MSQDILYPLLRRVGSILAGALVAYGVADADANLIAEGAVALVAVLIDLRSSYLARKQ